MSTIYVYKEAAGDNDGTTWENAYTSLATALAAASDGDVVRVKFCAFYPTAPYEIPEGVSVYGGYHPSLTGTDTSNRPMKTFVDGASTYQGFLIENSDVILDGFVIQNCASADGAGIGIISTEYVYGSELLTDGDMEASGTTAWSSSNLATLAKDDITYYEGAQSLYVEASEPDGYAYQTILTSGHTYRVTGWVQCSSATAKVMEGTTELWSYSSGGSSWHEVDEEFTATASDLRLFVDPGEGDDARFDYFSVKEKLDGTLTDVTVDNCTIKNCSASDDGGGVYIEYANVEMDNVTILNCSATYDGGGLCTEQKCTLLMANSVVQYCSAGDDGGGIALTGNDADNDYELKYCRILDNDAGDYGAGVYIYDNSGSETRLTRCVISDNTSDDGISHLGGDAIFTNCTIADNEDADGIYTSPAVYLTVVNCIIWGNSNQITGSGTISVTYSDVEGGYTGTGNVNDDPLFVDAGNHAYALSAISDCVDSANSGATYWESSDMLGNAPYDHPDVSNTGTGDPAYSDMGAYEFGGLPTYTLPMSDYYIDLSEDLYPDYMYQYAIVRLPEMPRQVGGHGLGDTPLHVRHQISSEIEIDETDTELREFVHVDNVRASQRSSTGTAYSTPTRDVDYPSAYQSDGDEHVAEEIAYPDGEMMSQVPIVGEYFRYAIIMMSWYCNVDEDGDVVRIYNVDINQIHDQGYPSYYFEDFPSSMHPGGTVFAPDVPLSAWHLKALQSAITKMIYEAVTQISIPVFGLSRDPD